MASERAPCQSLLFIAPFHVNHSLHLFKGECVLDLSLLAFNSPYSSTNLSGDRGYPADNSPLPVVIVETNLHLPNRGQRDCGTIFPSVIHPRRCTTGVLYLEVFVVMHLTTMYTQSGLTSTAPHSTVMQSTESQTALWQLCI